MEQYRITINKYRAKDLSLRENGIWIFSYDHRSVKELRLPALPPAKYFIHKSQICDCIDKNGERFIYFPDDQLPDSRNDIIRDITKFIDSKTVSKFIWSRWKNKFPYQGE